MCKYTVQLTRDKTPQIEITAVLLCIYIYEVGFTLENLKMFTVFDSFFRYAPWNWKLKIDNKNGVLEKGSDSDGQ